MRRFSFSLALQKFQQSPIFSLHPPAFPLLNTKIISILAVSVLLYACGGGGVRRQTLLDKVSSDLRDTLAHLG
jgi:hypothetical protein